MDVIVIFKFKLNYYSNLTFSYRYKNLIKNYSANIRGKSSAVKRKSSLISGIEIYFSGKSGKFEGAFQLFRKMAGVIPVLPENGGVPDLPI